VPCPADTEGWGIGLALGRTIEPRLGDWPIRIAIAVRQDDDVSRGGRGILDAVETNEGRPFGDEVIVDAPICARREHRLQELLPCAERVEIRAATRILHEDNTPAHASAFLSFLGTLNPPESQ
jgi:hypothetical protein